MVIPQDVNSMDDLEAMILTSVLGIYVSLKDDLISLQQAQAYLLSLDTVKLFKELSFSKRLVSLIEKGAHLQDFPLYGEDYEKQLDKLIASSKRLIGRYYTEYDVSETTGIVN